MNRSWIDSLSSIPRSRVGLGLSSIPRLRVGLGLFAVPRSRVGWDCLLSLAYASGWDCLLSLAYASGWDCWLSLAYASGWDLCPSLTRGVGICVPRLRVGLGLVVVIVRPCGLSALRLMKTGASARRLSSHAAGENWG
ncbi:MAG: hypothetical protein ACK5RF_12305 [Pirellula sp.]